MKKLLISLIVGAVFIGTGVGVLFMEIAEFTTAEYLPYVKQEKAETFTFTDSEIFDNSERAKIDIHLGEYFENNGKYEIVEEKRGIFGFGKSATISIYELADAIEFAQKYVKK